MDRGAEWATVHGVAESRTGLNNFPSLTHHFSRFHISCIFFFHWFQRQKRVCGGQNSKLTAKISHSLPLYMWHSLP